MSIIIALPIAAALAIRFQKKIEETTALAIFAIITILYFSGLVTTFGPGLVVSFVAAILAFGYTLFMLAKDRTLFKKYIFTPGLVVLLVLSVYFLFVSYGRYFNAGTDEKHHWALAVKYFYMLSDYSNVPGTTDLSVFHCPAVTLWAYFSTKLWVTCSIGMAMWGQQIMAIALMIPVLRNVNSFKETKKILLFSLFMLVLPYCLRDPTAKFVGYATMQPDFVQYLLFGFSLICFKEYYEKKDNFYLWSSVFGVFILTVSKRTGIIDAVIYLFIVYATVLLHGKLEIKKLWGIMVANIASMLLGYLSWEAYLIASGSTTGGLSKVVFKAADKLMQMGPLVVLALLVAAVVFVIAFITNQKKHPLVIISLISIAYLAVCIGYSVIYDSDAGFKKEAVRYVIRTLVGYDLYSYTELQLDAIQIGRLIPMSIGLFLILIYFIWRYCLKNKTYDKNRDQFFQYYLVFTIIGYLFMQVFRYMGAVTSMAYKNQPSLATADNYLGGYLLAIMLLLVDEIVKNYKVHEEISGKAAIIALIVIMAFFDCSSVFNNLVEKPKEHYFYALDGFSFDFGDKVYLMDTNIEGENLSHDFYYQAAPAKAATGTWYVDGYMGEKFTVEQVSDKLIQGGFNYVYIENLGPDFKEYYADLFADPTTIDNNHIYSVDATGNKVVLELVR
ncbi:hypothetical protein [Butyrivibrio sp. MC2021]|uniref:hypothetical protein n=1 Tax=Butyrivibrio sp. MC2021 TaxID=1408306 RepID=UPI00047C38A6|nr:hypothetical protein [Butyrivibrio sp. MC2021]